MSQLPRPSLSIYIGLVIALIQWALSLFGVTVNLWLGCVLWAAVTVLFVDFVWRSEWTVNTSLFFRGLLSGAVIILMALLAWKPVTGQYEREHTKAVAKPEAAAPPQAKLDPPRQAIRQPKETKQEQPAKVEAHNDLKLVFKNSPLFTDARKQNISRDMNLFYLYLIQIGFNAPKEVPSLGTYTKYMWIGGSQPVYEHSIFISEREIDDPSYIARMYARYAFNALLKEAVPEEKHGERDNRISVILEDYFIASYSNKPPSLIGSNNWLAALWEIRQKHGKYYVDKMMYFAFKSMNDYRSKEEYKDFDLYFKHYILHGASILENDRRNLQTFQDVEKIIKSHVQIP